MVILFGSSFEEAGPDGLISPAKARNSLESRADRIFVIGVVLIQCFKLFKGLKYAVLSMVLCTIKNH